VSEPDASFASEPITPRGVAAFAHAHVGRLWLVQLVAASLVAVAVLWFFNDSCAPTIAKAIRNLEDSGEIHTGELSWTGASPQVLAEERVLAFDIDLNHFFHPAGLLCGYPLPLQSGGPGHPDLAG